MPFHLGTRKPALALSLVGLILIGIALYFRWWDRYVEVGLGKWAASELARRTDSTYHLVLGDLTFRPLSGLLLFDSATVVTDSARNLSRRTPLPDLHARAFQCEVSGVDVPRLLFRKSFDARLLGCHRMVVGINLPPPVKRDRKAPGDMAGINTRIMRGARPLGVSLFRVAEVSFPSLSLTLRRPGQHGGASAVLEQAQFNVVDLVFDPTAEPRSGRIVSSHYARIVATGLVVHPDTLNAIAIARLDAGITDSTLGLAAARHGPPMTDEEWVRKQRVRHDRVRFTLDSLEGRGVAYRSLVATGDIAIRAIDMRGARLDVLTDKRIPAGPPRRHRSPQAVAAAADPAFGADTVRIIGSRIVYHERKPEHERAGQLSFDAVRGRILDLHLPSRGTPLRIEASARLMNEGLLSVHATVPLDARDFRFELAGKLGPMPAVALNGFLAENEAIKLNKGQVDSIEFREVAVRGQATTTLIPRYRELSVESTQKGGGVRGSVKRALVKFVANTFKVRSENPDDHGKRLRTATTARTYDPANSWIQFLWFGLRDGLKVIVVK